MSDRILVYVRWKAEPRIWVVVTNPGAPEEVKAALECSLKPYSHEPFRMPDGTTSKIGLGPGPSNKKNIVERTRVQCRRLAREGYKLELFVMRRNSRIGRGDYAKSTYGGDPRKSKG